MTALVKPHRYLISTDLDGTLLDHYTYSFAPACQTLQKLQQHGHLVFPNTSKTFAELIAFQQEAQLNGPFIFENGAGIAIPKSLLPFDSDTSQFEELQGYWVKSFSQTRDYWLELIRQEAADYSDAYTGFSEMSVARLIALTDLSEARAKLALQRQFGEPLYWHGDESEKQAFIALMTKAGATLLQGGRFLHVCGATDKGRALQWLWKLLVTQHPNTQYVTIALGDSGNDTAMLEAADIAVQIKSDQHPFPTIKKQEQVYQSTHCGPVGWSECLEQIVFN